MTEPAKDTSKPSRAEIDKAARQAIAAKYSTEEAAATRAQLVSQSALYAIDAGFNLTEVVRGCKRPKCERWEESLLTETEVQSTSFDQLGNYGIKTGQQLGVDDGGQIVQLHSKPWLLVIDFDRDKQVEGSQPLSALETFGQTFIECEGKAAYENFMSCVGRASTPNGSHVFCVLPHGIKMKGKTKIYSFPAHQGGDGSAIDLRCDRNQVLASGSEVSTVRNHDGTVVQHGGRYLWYKDGFRRFDDLPALPLSMCDWFGDALIEQTVTQESEAQPFGDVPEHALGYEGQGLVHGMKALAPTDPTRVKSALMHSIATNGPRYTDRDTWRDGILFPLSGMAGTGQLDEEAAKSIYDAACLAAPGEKTDNEDQWSKAVADAKQRAKSDEPLRGQKSIIDQATADGWNDPNPQAAVGPQWLGGLTAKGIPILNALNAEAELQRMGFDARFNLRRFEHEVLIPEAYVTAASAVGSGWVRLDDQALRLVTNKVSESAGRSFPGAAVDEALMLIGERLSFDPVKDYFERLKWDGVKRIDTWLTAYLGVADTLLHRQWARLWLIAAVARTCCPGCKWDFVLMLASEEGLGKSSIGSALIGDDYFTDQLEIGAEAKQVIEQTAGALIVEIGEMRGMSNRDLGAIKHMISARSDKARLAYDRKVTERLRRFIMYGTTNFDTPLRDQSGNRRFWTVRVSNILIPELKRDASQLWAEAVHLFNAEFKGDASRVKLDEAYFDAARAVQQEFTEAPVWGDKLKNLLTKDCSDLIAITLQDGRQVRWIPTSRAIEAIVPGIEINAGHSRKLAEAMKELGGFSHRHKGTRGYAFANHIYTALVDHTETAKTTSIDAG